MQGDNDERERRGPVFGCVAVAILLLPILYVLSFGPACWLGNNGFLPDEAKFVYMPLALLAQYCEPAREALQWYVDLWR